MRAVVGIGDDAAIISTSKKTAITVDMMVENVHFDLSYTKSQELGHKAIAINLSDLAAMGAKPEYVLISLGIRKKLNNDFFKRLYHGMKKLCDKFHVEIIGGNISRSSELILDVVACGSIIKSPILRSGAKIGDKVGITGFTGFSALARQCLIRYNRKKYNNLIKAHLTPMPRVREGIILAKESLVNSMIDISDGLSSELYHISEESNVGIIIDNIPISKKLTKISKELKIDPLELIFHGGEDYELLFTFTPKNEKRITENLMHIGLKPIFIGYVVNEKTVRIETKNISMKLEKKGWNHLSS